jgi:hypothetical protein
MGSDAGGVRQHQLCLNYALYRAKREKNRGRNVLFLLNEERISPN